MDSSARKSFSAQTLATLRKLAKSLASWPSQLSDAALAVEPIASTTCVIFVLTVKICSNQDLLYSLSSRPSISVVVIQDFFGGHRIVLCFGAVAVAFASSFSFHLLAFSSFLASLIATYGCPATLEPLSGQLPEMRKL